MAVKEASLGVGVGFSAVLLAAVFRACSSSIVAGLALLGGLGVFCIKGIYNPASVQSVQDNLDDKIDTQVRALAADKADLTFLCALLPQTPASVPGP
jgi:hypothetical protein